MGSLVSCIADFACVAGIASIAYIAFGIASSFKSSFALNLNWGLGLVVISADAESYARFGFALAARGCVGDGTSAWPAAV